MGTLPVGEGAVEVVARVVAVVERREGVVVAEGRVRARAVLQRLCARLQQTRRGETLRAAALLQLYFIWKRQNICVITAFSDLLLDYIFSS